MSRCQSVIRPVLRQVRVRGATDRCAWRLDLANCPTPEDSPSWDCAPRTQLSLRVLKECLERHSDQSARQDVAGRRGSVQPAAQSPSTTAGLGFERDHIGPASVIRRHRTCHRARQLHSSEWFPQDRALVWAGRKLLDIGGVSRHEQDVPRRRVPKAKCIHQLISVHFRHGIVDERQIERLASTKDPRASGALLASVTV